MWWNCQSYPQASQLNDLIAVCRFNALCIWLTRCVFCTTVINELVFVFRPSRSTTERSPTFFSSYSSLSWASSSWICWWYNYSLVMLGRGLNLLALIIVVRKRVKPLTAICIELMLTWKKTVAAPRVAESEVKCPTPTPTFPKFPTQHNMNQVWISTIL